MTSSSPAAALPVSHGELRALFPSLSQEVNGHPAVFLDGPGGTQVPRSVMEAMSGYLSHDNANTGGPLATSRRSPSGHPVPGVKGTPSLLRIGSSGGGSRRRFDGHPEAIGRPT